MKTEKRTFLNRELQILELHLADDITASTSGSPETDIYQYIQQQYKFGLFPQIIGEKNGILEILWESSKDESAVCFTSNGRVVNAIIFKSDFSSTAAFMNALRGASIHTFSVALSKQGWRVTREFEGFDQTISFICPIQVPVPVC
ncbi:hypothetical protein KBA63_03465 [Candidatus Woesebacteria bacterium]|nr:hypothetical protein [Candidatus Woesebacteria bacterium]